MTAYYGGKNRLGNKIASIIKELEILMTNDDDHTYWEPFSGMCGVMRHITNSDRVGSDINGDVISMWQAVQNGWIPPTNCTEKQFEIIKKSKSPSPLRGFIGHACSWRGQFFKSFAGKYKNNNFAMTGSNSVLKVLDKVQTVEFLHGSYENFDPKYCVIYCDPPYSSDNSGIAGYFKDFDHHNFWEVIRKWCRYNLVIISETDAPSDFVCIWKQNQNVNKNHSYEEKLFIHQNQQNYCTKWKKFTKGRIT